MNPLWYFDANAWLGQPVFEPRTGGLSHYAGPEDLLAAMDFYGVDHALVSHYRSLFGDPMRANRELIGEIGGSARNARLHPCWTLLAGHTGEVPGGEALAAELRRERVRAVRLVVGPYNLVFADWLLGDLLDTLEKEGILTILQLPTLGVPVPEKEDVFLSALDQICARHPGLRLVAGGRLRNLYALMERHRNLLTSLAWDPHPDFVEDVCRRFGAERLLFATPYSENAREISGMPMLQLTHAAVGREAKQRIAGENLAELLGLEVSAQPGLPGKQRFQQLHEGRPSPWPIVDIHAHAGRSWNWEHKPSADLAGLSACMERIGAKTVCVNSTEAVLGGDHVRGNEELARDMRRFPGRFIGFAVVNPHFDGVEEYIRHCVEGLGFRGIKIHPRVHRCAIIDPRYRPVWQASARYRIPVLCHTGQGQAFSEPEQFASVAGEHPRGLFIVGHTGETFAGIGQCIALANTQANIWLDLSGWAFMNRGYLEYLVQRVDLRRILFGSDYSWIDLRCAAATVLFAALSDGQKAAILSENARAVLPEGAG